MYMYIVAQDEHSVVPLLTQPPPYDVAVDLPSYEEAERSKVEEAERAEQLERERRRNQVNVTSAVTTLVRWSLNGVPIVPCWVDFYPCSVCFSFFYRSGNTGQYYTI